MEIDVGSHRQLGEARTFHEQPRGQPHYRVADEDRFATACADGAGGIATGAGIGPARWPDHNAAL